MKFKVLVEYEYPIEHKTPVKAELILHGDRVVTDNIKWIEQEPQTFKWCTDCKEYDQEKHCCHRWSKVIRDTVEEMKQEPKTGHWIWCVGSHKCSNCEEYTCFSHKELLRYCPNCGAKMVEPQESENP